jgi:hypothetical protein
VRAFAVTLDQVSKHQDIVTVTMTSGVTTLEELKFAGIAHELEVTLVVTNRRYAK